MQPTNTVDNKHNSEICVIGQTTLDNGLTIGVNVQIEANSEGDTIDESYLFLQSPTMGQVIVGDENNAGYLLHVTAPDGGVSLDSGDLCNIRAFEVGGQAFLRAAAASSSTARSAPPTCVCSTTTPVSSPTSRRASPGSRQACPTFPRSRDGGDNNSALKRSGIFDANRADSGADAGHQQRLGRWPELHRHVRQSRRAGLRRLSVGRNRLERVRRLRRQPRSSSRRMTI